MKWLCTLVTSNLGRVSLQFFVLSELLKPDGNGYMGFFDESSTGPAFYHIRSIRTMELVPFPAEYAAERKPA